jgi:predicted peroxiredoxin
VSKNKESEKMSESGEKFDSLGIIITTTPNVQDQALEAVEVGEKAQSSGKEIGIFLISDGVWNSLKGSGPVSEKLIGLMGKGAKVYASDEHARAGGFPKERALEGVEFVEDMYGVLVDKVMEEWDKVMIW